MKASVGEILDILTSLLLFILFIQLAQSKEFFVSTGHSLWDTPNSYS